ncbi:MvaI/BcnI family restriction endonuclease [Palleronia caenipelagi]|uniref:MvaI/BcnI family restriction endonuclease n=1 Tax=Palleronia caenipelagi TaxID=2489174 RepID=UPI001C8F34E1|nr:MvaI/BcnI family restriction endonuclease [Palleronia caenipelagi]
MAAIEVSGDHAARSHIPKITALTLQCRGGYTLEAELGISPNGYAEPDYLGWEVKQYGVRDFVNYLAKSPVTLMTPEPTGGLYREQGVEAFLRRYGYPDKSGKPGRINFGGIYANGRDFHADTGLKLVLEGFDADKGKITNVDGQIALIDRDDVVAASWGFRGVIGHWNRKHAKAVYVPSLMRAPPPEYAYGARVELCEGTDVLLLLGALASGAIYYDPGMKMERADTPAPVTKRRSQFRVRHNDLTTLYQASVHENIDP